MKYLKVLGVVLVVYGSLVLVLEGVIARSQPDMDDGVVLIVKNSDGGTFARTLYGFRHNDGLYVASNHWFRQWYNGALEVPDVEVVVDEKRRPYRAAVPVGEELAQLRQHYSMGFVLRLLCGFAPSKFLRLDPVAPGYSMLNGLW